MAEVEHKIRIVTEVDSSGSAAELKALQDKLKNLGNEAQKAGQKLGGGAGGGSGGLFSAFRSMKAQVIGVTATITAMVATVAKATSQFNQYDTAVRRLTTNLDLIGIRSGTFVKRLTDQASALEKTSRFSDDVIVSMQSMLVSFGVAPTRIKPATQAIVDFAAATGKDLKDAAQEVIQSMNGIIPRGSELKQVLQGMTAESLKAGDGLQKIANRFKGAASRDVQTFSGQIAQLGHEFNKLFKEIGGVIANSGAFKSALSGILSTIRSITGAVKPDDELATLQKRFSKTEGQDPIDFRGGEAGKQAQLMRLDAQISALIKKRADAQNLLNQKEREEVALAEKGLRIQRESVALAEKQEELRPKLDDLRKTLREELQTEEEKIAFEAREQKNLIEEGRKLKLLSLSEEREMLEKVLESRFEKEEELQNKIHKKRLDDAEKETQELLQSIQILQQASQSAGSLIGGVAGGVGTGTPQGAAIGASIGSFVQSTAVQINQGGFFGSFMDDVKEMAKASFKVGAAVFTAGLSEIIPGLFGGGEKYYSNFGEAVAAKIDASEFAKSIRQMAQSISSAVDAFRTTAERLAQASMTSRSTYGRRGGSISNVLDQVSFKSQDHTNYTGFSGTVSEAMQQGLSLDNGRFATKDPKKYAEAMAELGQQLAEEAAQIANIANLRIQSLQEETQALIDLNNKALQPILQEIERLKSGRSGLADVFKGAIATVSGALMSPEQTVEQLQDQYRNATGEERGTLGGQLAGALQGQFQNAQALAASGAISGEELQRIQADILAQLEETQTESLSEFDRLIASNQVQADALILANQTLTDTMNERIKELKAVAVKQVTILENILLSIRNGNFAGLSRYAGGTSYVPTTGPAILHQGEAVVPASRNRGGGLVININGLPATGMDRSAIAKAVRDVLNQNLSNVRGAIARGR